MIILKENKRKRMKKKEYLYLNSNMIILKVTIAVLTLITVIHLNSNMIILKAVTANCLKIISILFKFQYDNT